MRTLVIVGLVVGPVLVLGAPVALSRGVTPPPGAANGAFALAGVAALGGIVLLLLSLRRRPASATRPAALPPGTPAVPLTVIPRRTEPRYLAADPDEASEPTPRMIFCHPSTRLPEPRTGEEPEPLTTPTQRSRSRYVTLRTRRQPARTSVTAG